MHAGYRTAALVLAGLAALVLPVSPAAARSFKCSISTEAYGDVVASGIKPVSPDLGKGSPGLSACIVADAVAGEAYLTIAMDHSADPYRPYPTSLKLTLNRPGDVNAIEIWRYRIRYPAKGSLHGFAVARCAGQKVTFTLLPHPPKVIGS
jgi:hypothetical protein